MKKNNTATFVVIALIILGYLGLKVSQKFAFNKEYEAKYNFIVIKQQPGPRGFTSLYFTKKDYVHLGFYSNWEPDETFVGDSISKDKNSREIRVYKKDNNKYEYYKSMDMIVD